MTFVTTSGYVINLRWVTYVERSGQGAVVYFVGGGSAALVGEEVETLITAVSLRRNRGGGV